MSFSEFTIFVEGDDDSRFFKSHYIKSRIKSKVGSSVSVRKWKNVKKEVIGKIIDVLDQKGGRYIFVVDINSRPCVTAKKQQITKTFPGLDNKKIIVVIKEIEGWYLAGINDACCMKMGITVPETTSEVSKRDFARIYSPEFDSRVDFMVEIMKAFCMQTAQSKNESFKYFCKHLNL